ncbi:MAG: patatin family protein [Acutalibacteraceae bacterium]|nr:patatin family protein [Acutalibacteraceae bacterium]
MTGLVLEGGGMRGMFTAGILDVMMENGILFDGLIGVSAGAAFGCNYKSNQIGRSIRYNIKYCKDKRYCSMYSLIKTGDMFGADFCYHELPERLDKFDYDAFSTNPTAFYVVCTDVSTGKPIYKQIKSADYNEMEWIRASASLPLVSRIVEADGKKLLDGGLVDSIPLEYFQSIGYEKNVVVLTQPDGYVKKPNKASRIVKMQYRKYPNLIKAVEERHLMYNAQLRYVKDAEKSGNTFVIKPDSVLSIGRIEHNPDNLKRVYEIGRSLMEKQLPKLKEFLK